MAPRGKGGGPHHRAARPLVIDLVPLFIVLVTFAAALAGLHQAPPEPQAVRLTRAEVQSGPTLAEADLDEAVAMLDRFAPTSRSAESTGDGLLLDIEPALVFGHRESSVRREAVVLLFRLSQALHDAAGDLRLTVSLPLDDPLASTRLASLLAELRRWEVSGSRLTAGFHAAGSRTLLELRLKGGLAS